VPPLLKRRPLPAFLEPTDSACLEPVDLADSRAHREEEYRKGLRAARLQARQEPRQVLQQPTAKRPPRLTGSLFPRPATASALHDPNRREVTIGDKDSLIDL
jgi:hypothetical protein